MTSQAPAAGVPPSYRWTIALCLGVASWAVNLPTISLGLLFPSIREEFNLTPVQEGWLGSAVQVGSIVFMVAAVAKLSKASPRPLFLWSMAIGTLGVFLMGAATGFLMLLFVRLLFGGISSTRSPGRALFVEMWFPKKEFPIVNGIAISLQGVSEFTALAVTPWIEELTGSWRATLFIIGGVHALILLVWIVFGKERRTPAFQERMRSAPPLSVKTAFGYKQIWLASFACLGGFLAWTAFAVFWPSFMLETRDFPLRKSGFLIGLVPLASVFAGITLGVVASRIDDRRPIFVAAGAILIAGMLGLMVTDGYPLLVLCVVAVGVAWGVTPLLFTVPFEVPDIPVTHIAAGLTLVTVAATVVSSVGPLIAGAITDVTDSRFIALVACATAGASMVVFPLFLKPSAKQSSAR